MHTEQFKDGKGGYKSLKTLFGQKGTAELYPFLLLLSFSLEGEKSCSKFIPVDKQPLVVSPSAWTWKPCLPGFSPSTFPVTDVGPVKCNTINNKEVRSWFAYKTLCCQTTVRLQDPKFTFFRASKAVLNMQPCKIFLTSKFNIYLFPTQPIKLKHGRQIGGRLLIAKHLDQLFWLANIS